MFERFKRRSAKDEERRGVATAPAGRRFERDRDGDGVREERTAMRDPGRARGGTAVADAETVRRVRARQREEFGGILLILVLGVAYYCGGYVSGRMSRFDGARQGTAVWALGLAVTITLAVAGALFGAEYNVLERLNLPRIPIEEGSLTAGAAIALIAVVLVTLVAAATGGKAGERFHRKVDRLAYRD